MHEGYLIVRLKTARGALPVTGTIEIIGTGGGGEGVARTLQTDASGVSERVSLPCPKAAYSQDPYETELPYGLYTVAVTAENFESLVIRNVQIYEGIEAELPLEMVPVYEGIDRRQGRTIPTSEYEIPAPAIRARSQSGAGPLLNCEEAQVQNEVYIPQYITVHLGTPASSARNVTLGFAAYIKNVCSSEIYPTWPENAIRANVIAQISLALNRVYTDWYISKGYDFQITNSTQYDQYFVENRNIFSNISNIVDEIFNVYLRRVGDYAPYYAEYCNGTSVTCPGMSQWGTVNLANNGYTPIQILRYYYGSNFELVTTSDIRPIEVSYPGFPLSLGSTGQDVRTIQRQLARIARNYPSIGSVAVDGNYGSATQTAVRNFQRIFGLTADGIVGKRTWYQISYIYVAVKKLAELGSESEPYPDSGNQGGAGGRLQRGNTGAAVAWLQYRLSYLADTYDVGRIRSLNPDGVFGAQTEGAVKEFQTLVGLSADGIAGSRTLAALATRFGRAYDDNNPGSYFGAYPGFTLRQGDRGLRTKQMQFYLLFLSYTYSAIPKITADGIFGAATRSAVLAFQNLFGLTADGIVGRETWSRLVSAFNQALTDTLTAEELPDTYGGRILQPGSDGTKVLQLQYMLWAISRQIQSVPPPQSDGYYGSDTAASVRAFQQDQFLPETGKVNEETWDAIVDVFNQTQGNHGNCRFVDATYPGEVLKEGDVGVFVQIAKYYLAFVAAFDLNLIPVEAVDDVFTPAMALRIRDFQQESDLPVTGRIDEATWNALYRRYVAAYRVAYPACKDVVESAPGYTLKVGSEGALVVNLQQMLNALAPYYCDVLPLEADGIYGEKTADDVRALQMVFGLPATGETTPETYDAILQAFEALIMA